MALNILVVDDSSVMRTIIIRTLKLSGITLGEIYQAANGMEGLKVLESNWIDLALIDINMPVMTGEEMIDNIRKNPAIKDLPIIIISTETSGERIDILMEKSLGFIHKPFTPELLKENIIKITGVNDGKESGEGIIQSNGNDF